MRITKERMSMVLSNTMPGQDITNLLTSMNDDFTQKTRTPERAGKNLIKWGWAEKRGSGLVLTRKGYDER